MILVSISILVLFIIYVEDIEDTLGGNLCTITCIVGNRWLFSHSGLAENPTII